MTKEGLDYRSCLYVHWDREVRRELTLIQVRDEIWGGRTSRHTPLALDLVVVSSRIALEERVPLAWRVDPKR